MDVTTLTTPPPPPPSSSYQWTVEVSPIPTGPNPIPINITVYTTQNISQQLNNYRIEFDIYNVDTGSISPQRIKVNPVALSNGGYGYTISLDGNYHYSVNVFVYYVVNGVEIPQFAKWSITNYA